MAETKVVGGNVWAKVAEKFLKGLGVGIVTILLTYGLEFLQNPANFEGLPIWVNIAIPIITAALLAGKNAWDHRQQVVEV